MLPSTILPRFFGIPSFLILAVCLALSPAAAAQPRPYIGFVYPAGGQQGTTFLVRLGGQDVDDMNGVLVSGSGVTARIAENYRRLNLEEVRLLNEQLRILKRETLSQTARAELMSDDHSSLMSETTSEQPAATNEQAAAVALAEKEEVRQLITSIEKRTLEYNPTPASPAVASLAIVEVTIAPEAAPGEREIRLVTLRGISNPLPFHVGQLPEHSRKPMVTASLQVLGKESQALRRRLDSEIEERIALPCTVNGQIASGEVNAYRFEAREGQRLVITTLARQLVPFIADAVPGWFQPVLTLYDAQGKEVAYADDYEFRPDPTTCFTVPRDGEYVLVIRDSLYRGREDFVYRITVGELPFITSTFPLGERQGATERPTINGWNLEGAEVIPQAPDAAPGLHALAVNRKGFISNRAPFAVDTLPEALERERNNTLADAQPVTPPVILNGRIDRPDDQDVYRFTGKANDLVVAEVRARRLDSPLDSVLTLADATGKVVAFNDDHEDLAAGLNTHQADSYFLAQLPADGVYYVQLGDTARHGGEAFGYRLRLSAPQPDFELRVVPSSLGLPSRGTGTLTVYAQRKDGFSGPIKLGLKDPPAGFSAGTVTLTATQNVAKFPIKTTLTATPEPVCLTVVGSATLDQQEVLHEAVPAEDRMQAFLWRHLVPTKHLRALVFDPTYEPPPKRTAPPRQPVVRVVNAPVSPDPVGATNAPPERPRFTKEQVAAQLRQLKRLFEENMFTDEFYNEKLAELEVAE